MRCRIAEQQNVGKEGRMISIVKCIIQSPYVCFSVYMYYPYLVLVLELQP